MDWSRPLLPSLLLALAAAPVCAQATGPSAKGVLRGQVTDSLGLPVPLAEVAILKTGLRTVADSEGLFRIDNVPPGLYAVIVRSIGWKPYFFIIRVEANDEFVGRIGMVPAPQQLPEIIVEGGRFAKPPEYAFTHRFDDFFRRRQTRSGRFLVRGDPIFQSAYYTGDLLRMIPGVRVSFGTGGLPAVSFSRCQGANARIAVYIDGFRTMTNNPNEALEWLHASDVEAMEVYKGVGEIPGEFMGDACAVIAIWTR